MRALSFGGAALLVAAALVVWFANLDFRKLVKPDEGRYAEIAREMLVSGDWVTPRLNGIKYFEKPPLHYWAGATAFSLFGKNEWTARLWSALTGLGGVLFAWFLGRRLFGRGAGAYAAAVLASGLLYVFVAHINTLDMGLTFFLFLALGSFVLAQRDGVARSENRLWMHATWATMALAVLTKGLVGLVLPVLTLVLYSLLQRDFRIWTRLHLVTGIGLFLLVAAPWFALVSLRNPEFPWFFFVHEHLLRFTTTVHRRDEPWWYFGPLLLAGALPWTITMLDAASRAWRRDPHTHFQPRRFLLVWVIAVVAFFSLSGSKLPPYILPVFPALAVLAGWRLTTLPARALFWQLAPMTVLAVAAAVALLFIKQSGDTPIQLIAAFKTWAFCALALLVVATVFSLWRSRRNDLPQAVAATSVAALASFQLLLAGHNELAPSVSAYHLAQQIRPYLRPGIPIYSVAMYDQTLNFYLDRTVTLVQFRDELDFGLQQEPERGLPSFYDWAPVWRATPYALAIMPKELYEIVVAQNFPMTLIANDHQRYVVKTP